jgi:hypothetical protein
LSDGGKNPIKEEQSTERAPGFVASRDEIWERLQEGFAAQERERAEVEAEAEAVRRPAPVRLPPDATPAELLAANLRKALHRQAEILDLPIDPSDPRVARLIADVANQTLNAALRAQENTLAAKRDDDEHDRAMEAFIEERRQKALKMIARMEREAPGFAPKDNT